MRMPMKDQSEDDYSYEILNTAKELAKLQA